MDTISILGSGWLGSALARHLADRGYPIKLSSRSEHKQAALKKLGFDSYLVDIGQHHPVDSGFLDADTLIVNITSKNPGDFRHFIHAVERSPIRKVLFVSTTSVYQNLNREVSEDEGAEKPDSPHYQIEQLFQQASAFDTTILRLAGLVGKHRHPGHFFRGGKTFLQADAPVNLIHLDDCLGIIEAIVEQAAWGQIFNGCSCTHPRKRDFYARAAELAGMSLPDLDQSIASSHFKIVSSHKVKQVLKYQFRHPDLMQLAQAHYD